MPTYTNVSRDLLGITVRLGLALSKKLRWVKVEEDRLEPFLLGRVQRRGQVSVEEVLAENLAITIHRLEDFGVETNWRIRHENKLNVLPLNCGTDTLSRFPKTLICGNIS